MVWLMALAAILAFDFAGVFYGWNRVASVSIAVTSLLPS